MTDEETQTAHWLRIDPSSSQGTEVETWTSAYLPPRQAKGSRRVPLKLNLLFSDSVRLPAYLLED